MWRQAWHGKSLPGDFMRALVGNYFALCSRLLETTGMMSVVLSGGVFMNALLSVEVNERLTNAKDFGCTGIVGACRMTAD